MLNQGLDRVRLSLRGSLRRPRQSHTGAITTATRYKENLMISRRAQSIDASGIRKVFDLGATLSDPINLSIGQPDFDALDVIKESAKRAIDTRKSGYTVTQGILMLRMKLREKFGLTDESGKDVFITCGVSGGLMLGYMAMLDPGDEILLPDPYFCLYRDLALMLNAVPKYYDTYPTFGLSAERIEREITPKTRAILVMNPGNPTGYAAVERELNDVVALAKRKNIWLIYDEIYSAFSYDHAHVSCLGKYENTLVVNGFAKSHGIPGWRIGYAIGPNELIQNMLKIQQFSFVCAPSIVQWALVDGIDVDLSKKVAEYKEKRDFIYQALSSKFSVEKPTGAFYIFPEAPGGSGEAFVEKCVANNLLVIPGSVFSRRDSHFRISFAASMETLSRGAEVLNKLA